MNRIQELAEIWDGLRFYKERLEGVFQETEERTLKDEFPEKYEDDLGEIEEAIEAIEEAQDQIENTLSRYRD